MTVNIATERPNTADVIALVNELQTHLESFYPPESRHGFSIERLVAEGVAFFVLRVDGVAAGCGGILLVGEETCGRGCGGRPAVGGGAGSGDPRTTTAGGPRTAGQSAGDEAYGEIKRMYVRPAYRGAGFGKMILDRLAEYAIAHGVTQLRLETGIHQQAAIRLYEREGFRRIAPFGPYWDDPVSRCYEKRMGGPLS